MSIGDKLLKSAAAGGLTPSENFKAVKFSGNGSAGRAITVGFRPDYIVVKKISGADNWRAVDTTRGLEYINYWNLSNSQDGSSGNPYLSVSDTGFATTSNGNDNFNASGSDYVAYCWKANGGTTSSNGDGNITSTVQANTDAGFSIVKYSGTGSNVQVGHGLGAAPTMVIFKNLTDSVNWYVWTTATGSLIRLEGLNTNSAAVTSGLGTTLGASTIDFTNTSDFSTAGKDYIMYCFRDIDAYSKIGSYTGDRTNDVIVETGFEVGWVMIKAADATDDWFIISQETGDTQLYANNSNAESAFTGVSFLSNGFMLNGSANSGGTNNAGTTFIYMAFATDPDTEAPTLASSFNIETYTGTGSNKSIAGYGFAPNFLWIKQRSGTEQHYAYDTIRGYSKYLHTNLANAEGTDTSSRLASFDSDGFSLFTDAAVNGSGSTYVAWGWKANDDEPTLLPNSEESSLISKYKYANNVNDSFGDNNGTGSNLTYVSGKFGDAADFNGSSSKILYPQAAPFNDSNTILAISAWVKLDSASDEFVIMSASSTSDNADYMMLVVGGNQAGRVFMTDAPSNANEYQASFNSGNDTNWNHYVWQLSASGGIELWKNGTKQTRTETVQNGSLDETKWFGDLTYATDVQYATGINRVVTTGYSNGSIDQMRLFNAELTSSQINSLYNEANEALVSANANAGFSIVKYTGTYPTHQKIPHGLSAAPNMILIKNLADSADWEVYHSATGNTGNLVLNSNAAFATNSGFMADTSPTATVFTVGNDGYVNGAGDGHIAYCFHDVTGYSKFGTYTGSSSAKTVTTGFQPDFVMIKRTSGTEDWNIIDSRRGGDKRLYPDLSDAEVDESSDYITFASTSFTITQTSNTALNNNGDTYIYAAFKKNVASNTTLANSFKAVTYTGNSASDASGTTQAITGLGFKPDLVWIKRRDGAENHYLQDSVRGIKNQVYSNLTNAEYFESTAMSSFDSDGFTLGGYNGINNNGETYVAWCWKAGNTWQSNIDGTLPSTVNVNTANGFSVVHWYGTQAAGATVGHGLGAVPEMIIVKRLDYAEDWVVYHSSLGNTKTLNLNTNDAEVTDAAFNDTTPTSSVFTLSNCASGSCINSNSGNYIAYCWTPKSGFSKIGTYTGTGSSGNDIDVGFQPDFVMMKRTDDTGNWQIFAYDGANKELYPNLSDAEYTSGGNTINSDGFAPEGSSSWNVSSATYIYMAFKAN